MGHKFSAYLQYYIDFLKHNNIYKKQKHLLYETQIEKVFNWKKKNNFEKNLKWYLKFKNKKYNVKKKNLFKLKDWNFSYKKGSFFHKSKKFFVIEGFEIKKANREINSWEQPLIRQIGMKGGVIGLIRKKINCIPHYLVQAKFEPGNFKFIQISPSLQSTYSNLERVHRGKKNILLKLFLSKKAVTIIKKNVSEDGGRFFNKTNLHWIINFNGKIPKLDNSYKWLTLYEIHQLINYKSIVNPHLRAILSLL